MDLIWDEVCCQCFNAYVSVREARLRVAPCGHKLYVRYTSASLSMICVYSLTLCLPVWRHLLLSCQNCGSRLPTRGNRNCPAPGCDKFVSKATLSDKPVELTVYEAEIRERRRLSKMCVVKVLAVGKWAGGSPRARAVSTSPGAPSQRHASTTTTWNKLKSTVRAVVGGDSHCDGMTTLRGRSYEPCGQH